jgi:hypothetical protein
MPKVTKLPKMTKIMVSRCSVSIINECCKPMGNHINYIMLHFALPI